MRTYSADIIYPGNSPAIKNGYIAIDEQGKITKLGELTSDINIDQHFEGGICPGFINAHCHLELSFLFEKIPTHTGLIDFIKHVIELRDQFDHAVEQQAIQKAANDMEANGIVAVGDISNDRRSFSIKEASSLRFHTFVELFDFEPNQTMESIYKGIDVFSEYPKANQSTASITPHAPYSCTPTVTNFCDRFSSNHKALLSIHNQEQPEENQYFIDKTGAWNDLFKRTNQNQDWFVPARKSSMQAMGELLSGKNQIIYVHNTFTSAEDFLWANQQEQDSYFCTCPNANLYIENRLPDYSTWINANAKICVGTDSLASNWQLSILEELKTIQQHFSQLSTEKLIEWACWNGANALQFNADLGSLELGKTPGLVHISHLNGQFQLTTDSKASLLK